MKTIVSSIAVSLFAFITTSCVPPIQYGPVGAQPPYPGFQGPQQYMGYNPYRGYNPYGGGEPQVSGYTRQAHTVNRRAYIEVSGDAPQGATNNVRAGLEDYAEGVFRRTGRWPSQGQLTSAAQGLYSQQGCSLRPSSFGQPGGFAITRYQPGLN